jgi:2-methylaconitate isomerase
VHAGLAASSTYARVSSPALPRLALVGGPDPAHGSHLSLRVLSMQRMHHACPITVVMCAAAAAMLPGTVPSAAAPPLTAQAQGDTTVLVAHPTGMVAATVRMPDGLTVRSVAVTRTARRLLVGQAYL